MFGRKKAETPKPLSIVVNNEDSISEQENSFNEDASELDKKEKEIEEMRKKIEELKKLSNNAEKIKSELQASDKEEKPVEEDSEESFTESKLIKILTEDRNAIINIAQRLEALEAAIFRHRALI